MDVFLVCDIGGTNTRLYLFPAAREPAEPLTAQTFPSRRYASLEEILRTFTVDSGHRVTQAIFGVAGPVKSGRVEVTNLPWVIETSALRRQLGVERVTVMNDLQMAAYALPFLQPSELITLNPGQPVKHGTMAMIAPGTGLGETFLTHGPGGFTAHPSEGGHASFAPRDDLQMQLLHFLFSRYKHVSFERVCSGIGIPNIYQFLKQSGQSAFGQARDTQVEQASDPTPIIVDKAVQAPSDNPLCVKVVDTFVDILGAAAGNLALKVAATGGVFIGGGIAPRITDYLEKDLFMNAFTAKGRMRDFLLTVPVHVVLKPEVAVFGAACYATHISRPEEAV
jgi:glucokinase